MAEKGGAERPDEQIIIVVRDLLEKKKDPQFRDGFWFGVAYLELHTYLFFKHKVDPKIRKPAISFLAKEVYGKEAGLCDKLGADDGRAKGYVYCLLLLPTLFSQHITFDSAAVFRGLYGLFGKKKKEDAPDVHGGEREDAEKIVAGVKEALRGKNYGHIRGYEHSMNYLEAHARTFFENNKDSSSRERGLAILSAAVDDETRIFRRVVSDDTRKTGYAEGLKKLLSLMEDNIDFNPAYLFKALREAVRELVGEYKDVWLPE